MRDLHAIQVALDLGNTTSSCHRLQNKIIIQHRVKRDLTTVAYTIINGHLKRDKQRCSDSKDHIEAEKNQITKYDASIILCDVIDCMKERSNVQLLYYMFIEY